MASPEHHPEPDIFEVLRSDPSPSGSDKSERTSNEHSPSVFSPSKGEQSPSVRPHDRTLEVKEHPQSYKTSVLQTLAFPKSEHNLISFLFIWAVLCLSEFILPFAFIIGLIASMIIQAWFCAFRLDVIREAASGEPELPKLGREGDMFEGIVLPMLQWLGSWLLVLSPAFVYLVVSSIAQGETGLISELTGGLPAVLVRAARNPEATLFVIVTLAGVFMWPIVILCISLGGLATIVRLDLMVRTIVGTFPIYLFTTAIVLGVTLLRFAFELVLTGLIIQALAIGVRLYLEIVSMRMIGLYYHHFKDRFAWSWG